MLPRWLSLGPRTRIYRDRASPGAKNRSAPKVWPALSCEQSSTNPIEQGGTKMSRHTVSTPRSAGSLHALKISTSNKQQASILFNSDCSYAQPWPRAARRSNQNRKVYIGYTSTSKHNPRNDDVWRFSGRHHSWDFSTLDLKLNHQILATRTTA